jgi:hypothetical protein
MLAGGESGTRPRPGRCPLRFKFILRFKGFSTGRCYTGVLHRAENPHAVPDPAQKFENLVVPEEGPSPAARARRKDRDLAQPADREEAYRARPLRLRQRRARGGMVGSPRRFQARQPRAAAGERVRAPGRPADPAAAAAGAGERPET